MLLSLAECVREICRHQNKIPSGEAMLVGVSGIDGSGKGFIAKEIHKLLQNEGKNAVLINIDGWLNLPHVRFGSPDPPKHFYDHAIRFESMFSQLVLPFKKAGAIDLVADFTDETAIQYRPEHYLYTDVEIILLEGIYLFKKAFRHYFDLGIWIECTFETALERAIQRAQEGLSVSETIRAYEEIYFPAQRIHFKNDLPQLSADFTILNDYQLSS